jgi:hypothetical protein
MSGMKEEGLGTGYDPRVTRCRGRKTGPAICGILLLNLGLFALLGTAACSGGPGTVEQPPTAAPIPAPRAPAPPPASAIDGYDLAADEALGGHTLQRHVGKSDAELAERLRRERQISAASTYPDAGVASRVVGAALAANRGKVNAWAGRSGSRPNLVLVYRDPGPSPIGRSLNRNARATRPCSSARLVIRWLERERRWIVLTSYPETQ